MVWTTRWVKASVAAGVQVDCGGGTGVLSQLRSLPMKMPSIEGSARTLW
ncbi:hypothetical protein ACFWA5_47375 [Streptomyces mirabilis]